MVDERWWQLGVAIALRRIELGLGEKDTIREVSAANISVSEISPDEVSHSQVGTSEVSCNKVSPSQVSATQVGTFEIGPDEVGSSAVGLLTSSGFLLLARASARTSSLVRRSRALTSARCAATSSSKRESALR